MQSELQFVWARIDPERMFHERDDTMPFLAKHQVPQELPVLIGGLSPTLIMRPLKYIESILEQYSTPYSEFARIPIIVAKLTAIPITKLPHECFDTEPSQLSKPLWDLFKLHAFR